MCRHMTLIKSIIIILSMAKADKRFVRWSIILEETEKAFFVTCVLIEEICCSVERFMRNEEI